MIAELADALVQEKWSGLAGPFFHVLVFLKIKGERL